MAEIVVLANSRKLSHRCIAGIGVRTGRWVRPVSGLSDRAITWAMRELEGKEPQLLDVVSIPLERAGPEDDWQPENRLLKEGKWRLVRKAEPAEVVDYCETGGHLFYNGGDRVRSDELWDLPAASRRSLQLVRCRDATFYRTTSVRGSRQVRASFEYGNIRYDLAVTDPDAERDALAGVPIGPRCLLTISLAGRLSEQHPYCYKLVAGVIQM